ncbi:helix-turn-helix transcriptional regulator [Sinomicrobium weinanense]|uniref:Helix-turn-helix transcriptional regulator n=1 Tax=Sinomicrobium weinanense TaxID=2842200 RepID=A0A926JSM3_9FLAO|nr:helix-turn-helix transcriptional regulator [Sinomicrobium weinanense]MBC9796772.1 helix-turn-helix transcriptional regulator [Sinomicrobium weinanense]MBU3125541.1 helix-turn-helix transcriptional regulator [Sinomicrobium weinanense]
MLLEVFALQSHTFIGIFDTIRSCYIFQTSNTLDSAINKDNTDHYLGFVHNKKIQNRIIDLETEIIAQFTQEEKKDVRIFICGGYPVRADQNRIKHLLQRIPLAFGPKVYPGIYLDNIQNVAHLISGDGYWLRIKTGEKVYSWFSDEEKLLRHDIISKREKEVIKCWAHGYSLSKIGDTLFISINTVKNHLKACRNRLLARDNASLVQLCLLSGTIRPGAFL